MVVVFLSLVSTTQTLETMAKKYSLDEKLDSSADHIDDVETQQERVTSTKENNVGTTD